MFEHQNKDLIKKASVIEEGLDDLRRLRLFVVKVGILAQGKRRRSEQVQDEDFKAIERYPDSSIKFTEGRHWKKMDQGGVRPTKDKLFFLD
ncbi:hypothetical protein Trydic_g16701 [Trypoxylus dichotomus]